MDIWNKFINPNKQNTIIYSYIINTNIETFFIYMKKLLSLNNEDSTNYFFVKGNDTWKIGNKFIYYWLKTYKLYIQILEIIEEYDKIKISWEIETDFGLHYIKSYYLYRVTASEQTLAKIIITFREYISYNLLSLSQKKYFHSYINKETFIQKSKLIQKLKENSINYESCIINANCHEIWEFITDLKNLSNLAPIIGINLEVWGKPLQVGSFWKCYLKNYNKIVFLRIIKVEKNEKRNRWLYALETIGSYLFSFQQHEIEYCLTKINEEQTQLSFVHKYSQKIDKKNLKILSVNKKDILKRIKRYFEINNKNINKK
jgi:hypothetical protein